MKKEKTYKFILSTERKNSYGFILKTAGIDLSRFKDNPIMLYNHHYREVIGRWKNLSVNNENQLVGEAVFSDISKAREIEQLIVEGNLKATSVGIDILEVEIKDGIETVTKSELLEVSIVAVPSNADALGVVVYDDKKELMNKEKLNLHIQRKLNINKLNMDENQGFLQTLKARLGLSPKSAAVEIEEELFKIKADLSARDNAVKVLKEENKGLKEQLSVIHEAEVSGLLELAISEGKITINDKDSYVELAKVNLNAVKSMLDRIPSKKSLGKEITASDNGAILNYEELMKKDPKRLLRLKVENPEEYNKLINESK